MVRVRIFLQALDCYRYQDVIWIPDNKVVRPVGMSGISPVSPNLTGLCGANCELICAAISAIGILGIGLDFR